VPDFTGSARHKVALTLHGTMGNPAFVRFLEKVGEETLASFATHDFLILDCVQREQPVPKLLKSRLLLLRDLGLVESVGRGRGTRYLLSRRFHAELGQKGAYTRRRGLDQETNKALLLQHIKNNAETGVGFEELQQVLPALSRHQIQTLMRKLKASGVIRKVGEVRWARWFPSGSSSSPNKTHRNA